MKLVELEDTSWFPKVLRDQQLGYIGWLVKVLNLYKNIPKMLSSAISQTDISAIQDLASGSGEPMHSIISKIDHQASIFYSDKFPPKTHKPFTKGHYLSDPVDILHLQPKPEKFYTMFNAFHHFDDDEQIKIIGQFKEARASFFFVEVLEPTLAVLIKTVVLANTFGQLFLAPFVKPFSILRLILTYIIPINLITVTYDGIVSVLKSKNKKNYETLLTPYADSAYCIQIKKCPAPHRNSLIIIQGFPCHPS